MNRKGSGRKLIQHEMFCLEMWFNATGKFSSADKALLKNKIKGKENPKQKEPHNAHEQSWENRI